MTERDPYAVLGIPVHADANAIAAAYRDKARRHHPDVSAEPDAERRMAEINAAWATLRDPRRRSAWDRANLRANGAEQPAHGQSGHGSTHGPSDRPRRPNGGPAPSATPGAGRRPATGDARHGAAPSAPAWRRGPNGEGAAGPPPGPRRGSVLPFGRHIGWSLGEVARADPGYLLWLRERPEGAPFRGEIEQLLAAMAGGPATPSPSAGERRRRGVFG